MRKHERHRPWEVVPAAIEVASSNRLAESQRVMKCAIHCHAQAWTFMIGNTG